MAEQNRSELERDRDPMDEDMIGREEGEEEFEEGDEIEDEEESDDV